MDVVVSDVPPDDSVRKSDAEQLEGVVVVV